MNKLKVIAAQAQGLIPDALMLGGAGAVSYGAGLVYQPAGWIAAGVFALVGGVVLARGVK